MKRHEKADLIGDILDDRYPNPPIPLDYRDPYTLLARNRRAYRLASTDRDIPGSTVMPVPAARPRTRDDVSELWP